MCAWHVEFSLESLQECLASMEWNWSLLDAAGVNEP